LDLLLQGDSESEYAGRHSLQKRVAMTVEEVKAHLERGDVLYIVERATSRRGLPSVASFYLVVRGLLERIDPVIIYLLGGQRGQSTLLAVGRIQAASIHNPYTYTVEQLLNNVSLALFGKPDNIAYKVI
jgi:hypothetical protein